MALLADAARAGRGFVGAGLSGSGAAGKVFSVEGIEKGKLSDPVFWANTASRSISVRATSAGSSNLVPPF